MNKYNVVHFDVASFFNAAKTPEDVIPLMDGTIMGSFLQRKRSGGFASAIPRPSKTSGSGMTDT
ncbi:MAG: hypothetical protein IJ600_07285 [Lachnospiraceae bacterium]|nr:hypothetical protein [Lachnospiraceae bacterium]